MAIWKLKRALKATFSHRDWFGGGWAWGPALGLGQELGEGSGFSDQLLFAHKLYLALSHYHQAHFSAHLLCSQESKQALYSRLKT